MTTKIYRQPLADLIPCPFCDGRAKEYRRINANTVTCQDCGATLRQSEMGQGDAAERWNRRAARQEQPIATHTPAPAPTGAENSFRLKPNDATRTPDKAT